MSSRFAAPGSMHCTARPLAHNSPASPDFISVQPRSSLKRYARQLGTPLQLPEAASFAAIEAALVR
ncbi:MAG TPA: hypothetical protein VNN06_13105 [Ramlibacter sp.]|nr:hypothetical protein [Ramlibacter sp.]